MKKLLLSLGLSLSLVQANAHSDNELYQVIDKGMRYLASVQTQYGEFPTTFYPNQPSPNDILYANYDSNIFTTTLVADAIHNIPHPAVKLINKKVTKYLLSQLNNKQGLWSYFTTHNPAPLYPTTVYDLDDTAFASMVLQQNNVSFPDNKRAILANRAPNGALFTFIREEGEGNDIDCGVNANVLSYLQTNDEGVCGYINQAVSLNQSCANYYSQLDAYYLIARAYHSGIDCLAPAAQSIKHYIVKRMDNKGSIDDNPFETAVAANALIDVGYEGALLKKTINYLIAHQSKITGSWPSIPFWLWAATDDDGNPYLMGRSGSAAMTTAIAMKAIHRFAQKPV